MSMKIFKFVIYILFLSGLFWFNIISLQAQEKKINYIPINHASFIIQSALFENVALDVQRKVIDDMLDYASVHLLTEEKYMDEFKY